jgi:hypothetical protein
MIDFATFLEGAAERFGAENGIGDALVEVFKAVHGDALEGIVEFVDVGRVGEVLVYRAVAVFSNAAFV